MRTSGRLAAGVLLAAAPACAERFDAARLDRLYDAAPQRAALEVRPAPVRGRDAVKAKPLFSPLPFSGALKSSHGLLVVPPPQPDKPYRRLFKKLLANPERTDRYDDYVLAEAGRRGLDPRLLKSIIAAESEFNFQARSPKGAVGLMQVLPATAESMGVPRAMLKDPWQNIKAGAAYIAQLYAIVAKRYRLAGVRMADAPLWVVQRVIASYHAGPRFLARNTWYKSSRLYVRKVLLFYQSRVTDVRRSTSAALPEGVVSASYID